MLARTHRFHGHNSLNAVYRNGTTLRGSNVTLKVAPRTNNRPYRVAVVVSRKVSKSAVQRNRIRRRIYEVVRQNDENLTNKDLIFTIFSDQFVSLPAEELESSITQLLSKVSPASN